MFPMSTFGHKYNIYLILEGCIWRDVPLIIIPQNYYISWDTYCCKPAAHLQYLTLLILKLNNNWNVKWLSIIKTNMNRIVIKLGYSVVTKVANILLFALNNNISVLYSYRPFYPHNVHRIAIQQLQMFLSISIINVYDFDISNSTISFIIACKTWRISKIVNIVNK